MRIKVNCVRLEARRWDNEGTPYYNATFIPRRDLVNDGLFFLYDDPFITRDERMELQISFVKTNKFVPGKAYYLDISEAE